MLTGRRAFDGEDITDILSRILQREPEWAHLPAHLPPSIHRKTTQIFGSWTLSVEVSPVLPSIPRTILTPSGRLMGRVLYSHRTGKDSSIFTRAPRTGR